MCAKPRGAKSAVISDIVESIRESSTTGGGFVRYDRNTEIYVELIRIFLRQSSRAVSDLSLSRDGDSPFI